MSVWLPWIRRSRALSSSSRLMELLPSESKRAKKRSAKNDCREKRTKLFNNVLIIKTIIILIVFIVFTVFVLFI